ncbi:MAG: hypothetical protein FD156_2803 [Nitrospirae bacterium]|nr:MAG: hypothetical protein FD156_2803 [Nitrospirota bacterium]
MKVLIIALFVVFFFTACDEKPKNPVSEYGNSLTDAYKKGQQAGETANLDAVRKAVQAYYAQNGRYPQSLDEIKGSIGSEMDMSKYSYDPQTGTVNLKGN